MTTDPPWKNKTLTELEKEDLARIIDVNNPTHAKYIRGLPEFVERVSDRAEMEGFYAGKQSVEKRNGWGVWISGFATGVFIGYMLHALRLSLGGP